MKVQMNVRAITTFRKLLEKLVRKETGKRLALRRSDKKTSLPSAGPVEFGE